MEHPGARGRLRRSAIGAAVAATALLGCTKNPVGDQSGARGPVSAAMGATIAAVPPNGGKGGDPARGRIAFAACAGCHALAAGVNRIGPSLHGVVGRRAGQAPGFTYSTALRGSAIVWTRPALARFLAAPQATVPGTTMMFGGIADAGRRADLIAYLAAP